MLRSEGRSSWFRVVATVIALAPCAAVRAEDAPDENLQKVVELEGKVAEHLTAKDLSALVGDSKTAVALHAATEGKDPYRDRILKVLGSLAKHRSEEVMKAGMTGLGETKDLSGAKYIRGFLRPTEEATPKSELTTAIEVAAQIPHESLVEPLLAIVTDSKNYAVAAKAMESLGAFREAKRKREKILEELVKTVAKDKPGGRGQAGKSNQTNPDAGTGNTQGGAPSSRWGALSGALPRALNGLTGKNLGTPEDWFAAVKDHKARLSDLFESS